MRHERDLGSKPRPQRPLWLRGRLRGYRIHLRDRVTLSRVKELSHLVVPWHGASPCPVRGGFSDTKILINRTRVIWAVIRVESGHDCENVPGGKYRDAATHGPTGMAMAHITRRL